MGRLYGWSSSSVLVLTVSPDDYQGKSYPSTIPLTTPSVLLRKRERSWFLLVLASLSHVVYVSTGISRLFVTRLNWTRLLFFPADFRSSSGLYSRLQAEGKYDLDDPQQMYALHLSFSKPHFPLSFRRFDIEYFKLYPEVF